MTQASKILLPRTVQAIQQPEFKAIFVEEMSALNSSQLPLQQSLSYSSYVSNEAFQVMYISHQISSDELLIKSAIFYTGIIAGCSCADDPSPQDTQNEVCELMVAINLETSQASLELLEDTI